MKNIYVSIFLVFLPLFSIAQDDYVITLKGDTITGKASISTNKATIQLITMKNGKEKQRFKVYEIKSLLRDKKVYHTIKIENKYQLGLLVKQGYLSLYKYMDVQETASSDFSISVLVKVDGSYLTIPNIGFKKFMAKYLNDCETVRVGFEKDKYKKSDLIKIIDDYNFCIEKNSNKPSEMIIVNQNPDKTAKVEELITAVKKEISLENKEEVLEMLADLSSKIKTNTKIPTYLGNALRDSLKEHKELISQLSKILQ